MKIHIIFIISTHYKCEICDEERKTYGAAGVKEARYGADKIKYCTKNHDCKCSWQKFRVHFPRQKIRLFSNTCLDTLCKPHTSLKSYPSFKPPFDVLKILKKSHQKSKLRQGKKYKTKQKKNVERNSGLLWFSLTLLCDLSRRIVSSSQPIKSQT